MLSDSVGNELRIGDAVAVVDAAMTLAPVMRLGVVTMTHTNQWFNVDIYKPDEPEADDRWETLYNVDSDRVLKVNFKVVPEDYKTPFNLKMAEVL